MQHNIDSLHGWVLVGFTGALAVALVINAALAMSGAAELAWWQLPWLAVFYFLTKESLTLRQRVLLRRFAKALRNAARKTAAKVSQKILSFTVGAVRTLSAPFVHSGTKIQTEP